MKKLKIGVNNAPDALSRGELKNIVGGYFGSGSDDGSGSDSKCYNGDACSIVYTDSQGNSTSFPGECRENTSGFFCDLGSGSEVDISSNNGVSRCTRTK